MNRSKRVFVTIAAALGMTLSGCSMVEAAMTPQYDLTDQQRSHLNMTSRLGYSGLDRFEMVVQYPEGMGTISIDFLTRELDEVPPIQIGGTFKAADFIQDETFTPAIQHDGTYVTYWSDFGNLYNHTVETMVFRNPDATLFGGNGQVSVQEMQTFFKNDQTELVSLDYHGEDITWSSDCTIKLAFEGNTLITNAADDCRRYIEHSDTEGLLADLEDMWYSDVSHSDKP